VNIHADHGYSRKRYVAIPYLVCSTIDCHSKRCLRWACLL